MAEEDRLKRFKFLCLKEQRTVSLVNAPVLPPTNTLQTTVIVINKSGRTRISIRRVLGWLSGWGCGGPRDFSWSCLYTAHHFFLRRRVFGVTWQLGEEGCWRPLKPILGTVTATWPTSAFAYRPLLCQSCLLLHSTQEWALAQGNSVRGPHRDTPAPCRLPFSPPDLPLPALSLPNSRPGFQHFSNFSKLALIAEETRKKCQGNT